ncbi:MAG: hypothetical protein EPN41_14645, partial [Candidimonas sp.]
LQVEEGDPFLRRKFATSVFYAAHVLPRTQALAAAIVEGDVVGEISRQIFSA